jgi:hypothetical protein
VKQWIAAFEAIPQVDREERTRRGPDPPSAIRLSLSMIESARQSGRWPAMETLARAAEAEKVRAVWARLHQRLGR